MFERMKRKVRELQQSMVEQDVDVVLVMDPDSVYYFTGIHDYLGMDFGRPTIAIIPQEGDIRVVIPSLEQNMGRAMTWVADLLPWTDGIGDEWRGYLKDALRGKKSVGLEVDKTHAVLHNFLKEQFPVISGALTRAAFISGDVGSATFCTSMGMGLIHDVKPVKELIEGMVKEAEETIDSIKAMF